MAQTAANRTKYLKNLASRGNQCTAPSSRSGGRCTRRAMNGRTVCVTHGGRTSTGANNPNFKHGRYSRAMPSGLVVAYENALRDPDLISMRDELALLDVRQMDLLSQTEDGAGAWPALIETWKIFDGALRSGDRDDALGRVADLRTLMSQVARTAATWREIYQIIHLRTKVTDVERKRLEALQATLSAEQVLTVITTLALSIKKHVTDNLVRSRISMDIERVLRASVPGPMADSVRDRLPHPSYLAVNPATMDASTSHRDPDGAMEPPSEDENDDGAIEAAYTEHTAPDDQ